MTANLTAVERFLGTSYAAARHSGAEEWEPVPALPEGGVTLGPCWIDGARMVALRCGLEIFAVPPTTDGADAVDLEQQLEAEVGQLEAALHAGDAQGVLRQALAVARLAGRAAAIGADSDAVGKAAAFVEVAEQVLGEVLP